MPFTPNSLPASMVGPSCTVQMTKAQALLIRRGMLAALKRGEFVTDDEREEAQAIADMAAEVDPDAINGWNL